MHSGQLEARRVDAADRPPGVEGGKLPTRLEVRYHDKTYAVITVNSWKLAAAAK